MKGKKGATIYKETVKKEALRCEAVIGSLTPSNTRKYKLRNRLWEGDRPLYGISYNFIDSRFFNLFATVGGNRMEESFYTVTWSCNPKGELLLVAGGINGVIRVIDVGNEKLHKSIVGHGESINEIRTQMLKPSLVLSASKDESVRLWNVHTRICILIFAGAGGHRHEVLSVAFHPSDIYRFSSCGMDNTVKIWSMKGVCGQIHTNYVDCNRWLGDCILSKGVQNEMVLWEPIIKDQPPGVLPTSSKNTLFQNVTCGLSSSLVISITVLLL